MAMLLETQLLVARGLRNAQRLLRPLGPMEAAFPKLATGRSFVDVGALWNVHGKIAFLAESSGASSVTAVDLSSATDEYLAEHERRDSKVRFVQGDLHDEDVLAEIGLHDVVWCTGVLYHCPDPGAHRRMPAADHRSDAGAREFDSSPDCRITQRCGLLSGALGRGASRLRPRLRRSRGVGE